MTHKGYFYLASRYTDSQPEVRERRYLEAESALVWLLKQSIWTYSPIVHCHHLTERHELPIDAQYWSAFDHEMIRTSKGLIVLALPGWKESKGVTEEIAFAKEIGKPISYLALTSNVYRLESPDEPYAEAIAAAKPNSLMETVEEKIASWSLPSNKSEYR